MKKVLTVLLRILIVLIVLIILLIAVAGGYFFYTRWYKDQQETIIYSGDKRIIISKKEELEPTVTCLFMGVNGSLTDFIMLGKYDPNTREVFLMSIPRDTYIEKGGIDHKINSAYAKGYKPENTVNVVGEITGIKADYYILFKTKLLRDLVDEIDGVMVDVPINMSYDDPYQNLSIHLKKGLQKLDGKKAEQFVRFRKNNNGTGYARGDVDRIQAQQQFIKAMIGRCLEPQNLVKIGDLVTIVLDNTKTNITTEIASQYIDDAVAFQSDRVRMEVLPGEGGYSNGVSYFFMDKEAAKPLIDELFNSKTDLEEVERIKEEEAKNPISTPVIRTELSGDKLKIEVLNNGTSTANFNSVVEKLNSLGYDVVRVGNIKDSNDLSRVVSYVSSQKALEELNKIGEVVGIKKLETSASMNDGIDYTIILGSKYIP